MWLLSIISSSDYVSACCVRLKLDFLPCCESALQEEAGGMGHFPTREAGSSTHHGKLGLLSTQKQDVHLLLVAHVVLSCWLTAFIVVKMAMK